MDWVKTTAKLDANHLSIDFGVSYIKDFTVPFTSIESCSYVVAWLQDICIGYYLCQLGILTAEV